MVEELKLSHVHGCLIWCCV